MVIVSFPDDIEVYLGQLKSSNESIIDSKCLLKFEAASFCFDNNFSFSSNIFSCILLFLFEKYDLHTFQNGLELQSTLNFSNYCNLAYLFRFATKFCCRLNLTMSLGFFDLFALFLRRDLVIICLQRFLLKWCFDSLVKFLFFYEHVYLKLKQNYFKVCIGSHGRHTITNLNWPLSSCFKLRYINFFV